jgi:ribonuclease P protein component
MIAQKHRFHGHNKVDSVYRRGVTLRGSLLNLKYVPGNGSRPFRVAVVVSKKVHKSAVVRNRIRRRIYEIVREFDTATLIGSELVFIVYSDQLASLESARLKAGVGDLLQRATTSTASGAPRATMLDNKVS